MDSERTVQDKALECLDQLLLQNIQHHSQFHHEDDSQVLTWALLSLLSTESQELGYVPVTHCPYGGTFIIEFIIELCWSWKISSSNCWVYEDSILVFFPDLVHLYLLAFLWWQVLWSFPLLFSKYLPVSDWYPKSSFCFWQVRLFWHFIGLVDLITLQHFFPFDNICWAVTAQWALALINLNFHSSDLTDGFC